MSRIIINIISLTARSNYIHAFHLGLQCLPKYPFRGPWSEKGLIPIQHPPKSSLRIHAFAYYYKFLFYFFSRNNLEDIVQVQYLAICNNLSSLTLDGNPLCVAPSPGEESVSIIRPPYGPQHEKTCLRGFRQSKFQSSLLSYRD